MALRLVLGRAGSGKTTYCIQEIEQKLIEDPMGPPIIYLVPEQMTFQSEYKLIQRRGVQGMIRAQVFSFTRLAWRVLQEAGGLARTHLNQTGIHMFLVKVVEKEKGRLKVFADSADTSGFIAQLEELLTEFKRYNISPDLLRKKREELFSPGDGIPPQDRLMADKLHDFDLIYRRFEEELAGHYIHGEDYLKLLAEKIPEVDWLHQAEVYVDGFHSFSPQERLVLQKLMATVHRLTLTLTLDRVPRREPEPLDLFYLTGKTCRQVLELAQEADCEILKPVILEGGARFLHEDLAHLEKHYERPWSPLKEWGHIRLVAGVNRRAEVEHIAREMIRLVRDEGYRWRDMAVFIRNQEDYQPLLETVFADYAIPLFLDYKRPMLHHPLVELIRSSLEVIQDNWRHEAVIRCLKTELLFPLDTDKSAWREGVDRLENVALAYGIQGSRWYQPDPWRYRSKATLDEGEERQTERERQVEEEINRLRQLLLSPLVKLSREMGKSGTVREKCVALYLFLENLKIPQKLEQLREEALKRGDLTGAREHDQVWQAVINLLEQMVEFTGEERLSLDLFTKMMEAGLESLRFAQVPPAMDQVLVASVEHSRLTDIKCTFLLGANEGCLPAKPKEKGILSDQERERMAQEGVELALTGREQLLHEQFLIYLALASPSERLYVSYALADEEGETLLPSMVIKRLKDLFPGLTEEVADGEPLAGDEEKQLALITRPGPSLSSLTLALQTARRGDPIPSLWWDVYNWFVSQPDWKSRVEKVLSSLFYRNRAENLTPELSRSLYGTSLRLSVSRMEKFQACPFSHFAAYGLKLKRRQVYRLEAPDVGQLFHAALNKIAFRLAKEGRLWSQLSREECFRLAREAVEELAPAIQREILYSTSRYRYMKTKLQNVVGQAAHILGEQAKRSGFSPVGLELEFGPRGPLPPLTVNLDKGVKVDVVGRIDRVDKAQGSQGTLLRVIDYKSSGKNLNLNEVYHGLTLQLLIYLDVVLTHSEKWLGSPAEPAGILYFHVHNPLVQAKGKLAPEKIEQELLKKFKMRGLLIADPEVVQLMDTQLQRGSSPIVPAGLKKDGTFDKWSSVVSREDFERVRRFARRKVMQISQRLTAGDVTIGPYKYQNQTPCKWCEYRPVCQFDPLMEANAFQILSARKKDEILEAIRREGEEG